MTGWALGGGEMGIKGWNVPHLRIVSNHMQLNFRGFHGIHAKAVGLSHSCGDEIK